jgi:hypothetical protein
MVKLKLRSLVSFFRQNIFPGRPFSLRFNLNFYFEWISRINKQNFIALFITKDDYEVLEVPFGKRGQRPHQ